LEGSLSGVYTPSIHHHSFARPALRYDNRYSRTMRGMHGSRTNAAKQKALKSARTMQLATIPRSINYCNLDA
jgi:hypothetical protein